MRVHSDFFQRDVLDVAPELLGKKIIRCFSPNDYSENIITEVEAYRGEVDLACHARKGKTKRTQVMYAEGGVVYVYLIYGIFWMLNFVTSNEDNPQAILIRGLDTINGPGRLSKLLKIDGSFYGEDLANSNRLWIEDNDIKTHVFSGPRIGVDYAGDYWASVPWRFWIKP